MSDDYGGGFDDSGAPPTDYPSGSDPSYDPTLGGGDSGGGGGDAGGMVVDPKTGDVYDAQGNFVGNIDDPQFGGPGLGTNYGNSSGGGSGGGILDSIAKLLGTSGMNLATMLGMGGAGLGAYLNSKNTKKATNQMLGASQQANDVITKLLGGSSAAYQPFVDLGPYAINNLKGQAPSDLATKFAGSYAPLAGQFKPLGSGMGIGSGPNSFSALMKKGG